MERVYRQDRRYVALQRQRQRLRERRGQLREHRGRLRHERWDAFWMAANRHWLTMVLTVAATGVVYAGGVVWGHNFMSQGVACESTESLCYRLRLLGVRVIPQR